MFAHFAAIDWVVILLYAALLGAGGWWFTPRHTGTARDYFLAGGNVPAWLAAISVLSATQSAATFLGGPDFGYQGDFTYHGTFLGGLRAILWSDLVQFTVFLASALAVLVFLRLAIPDSNAQIVHALAHAPGGVDKLRLFDFSLDLSRPFSLLAIVTGIALLYIASSGLDQDVTQRLLACRDARTGARSLYLSVFAPVPVVAVFNTIGLLLHIFYARPEQMGGATAAAGQAFGGEKISIFMHYILTQLPPGLRGLVTAGIMAAAVATTNSALNAMSSVLIEDFYRPWRARRDPVPEYHYVQAGRAGMGLIGVAMLSVAVLSFYWQHYARLGLLEFALQVMVFAYAGLLGIYFAAVLTPRGNATSVIAALIAGFVVVLLLQPAIATAIGLPAMLCRFAFPNQLCIGTAIAFLVAIAPRRAGMVNIDEPRAE